MVFLRDLFRVSRYHTFHDKLESVSALAGWRDPLLENVHAIGANISGPEPFSLAEIAGQNGLNPLVRIEADLTGNEWFQKEIHPLLYEAYPLEGKIFLSPSNRSPDVLGLVPRRAVYLYQHPHEFILSDNQIQSGEIADVATVGRIDYYLAWSMYFDFVDLSNQAANHVAVFGHTPRLDRLIFGRFPYIKKGDYPVNINYVLPGKEVITSSYRHTIQNPID